MTQKYLIERIAEHLVQHGSATAKEIATALGVSTDRVGDSIKSERHFNRWGIYRHGYSTERRGGGHPPTIWSINVETYEQHLAKRRDMPWIAKRLFKDKLKPGPKPGPKLKPKATKASTAKEPKVDYSRTPPVYNGPRLTAWQPCSPYYKEHDDEHASPA